MASWYYERMGEDLKIERCPQDDKDGKVTGKCILNLPKWFDENPAERIRLGWTKHIYYEDKEIKEKWPHTQSQYLVQSTKQVDEYTVEDDYHVLNKSEEMMLFEEMLNTVQGFYGDGIVFM